jgi:MinD-like ATPase involved in chromosome partitioning or flagellar assembly
MSKVYTVISGKGGVGKTTIASNLGVSLSLMRKRTVVVDADLAMGGVATILGLFVHNVRECLKSGVESKVITASLSSFTATKGL